ncbi:hypothetical protein PIROE2DRAFT_10441 [Piromyces sp. E2]|nr:hypothetical protein PIROE2DRAFT_10441 [Piromyces sp. E2]|eukprot:OUM63086.1 hypothetical protein PIROE2DRAFT_10441 [Piromyces sp. E2]
MIYEYTIFLSTSVNSASLNILALGKTIYDKAFKILAKTIDKLTTPIEKTTSDSITDVDKPIAKDYVIEVLIKDIANNDATIDKRAENYGETAGYMCEYVCI